MLLVLLIGMSSAEADKSVVLVIGNNSCKTLPDLNNARTEARGMAAKLKGRCQSNANQSLHIKIMRISRRQLTPFGQGGGSVLFEFVATVEMTFEVEMVVDRGMNGGEFLECFYVSELRHCPLPSPERLV